MNTTLSDKERIDLDEVFLSISYSNRSFSTLLDEIFSKKNYVRFIEDTRKMAKIGKKVTQIS